MIKYTITHNLDKFFPNNNLKEQILKKILFIIENSKEMDISYEE